ncbi:metallophosphoesterase [Anatilimnocola sp. NA78]|uniref:metallophosphoesterase n=1 Tax=Anatilimnocola sp. NA78 TaxID=3415683 RepID=UPI003CE5C6B8
MRHATPDSLPIVRTRRSFLQQGSLWLLGGAVVGTSQLGTSPLSLLADDAERRVRFGLITDLHYADKPAAGSRHYRESLAKLAEAAGEFEKAKPDFVVELGDLIDAATSVETEKKYLGTINKQFAALPGDKHYVLGNHCVTTLTKDEFLGEVGRKESHYSFDAGGFHFVVLDACFRHDLQPYGRDNFKWNDANIPAEQIDWLRADLKRTSNRTIVFAHQRLDVKNDHGVKNAEQVRKVLEESGKVLAVFQGHSHKNDLKDIGGIHYCTLVAMVEGSGAANSGYSLLDCFADGTIRLHGFRQQAKYEWKT